MRDYIYSEWDPNNITLMDIKKLIYSAFDGLSAEIHVVRLDEVNDSIKITCYAPEPLMDCWFSNVNRICLYSRKKVLFH